VAIFTAAIGEITRMQRCVHFAQAEKSTNHIELANEDKLLNGGDKEFEAPH